MNLRIVIFAVVALAALLLVYFYLGKERSARYNWYQSLDKNSSQPYGTLVIKKMLELSHSGTKTTNEKEPIHKLLEGKNYKNTDYV
ncbi:MAG: hypothetical protein WDO15_28150 [Bacteroidota bacterium]